MSYSSGDEFSDDDEEVFNSIFGPVKSKQDVGIVENQDILPTKLIPNQDRHDSNNHNGTNNNDGNKGDNSTGIPETSKIIQLQGENAILRNKLERMNLQFEADQKRIREEYNKKLLDDKSKLIALQDDLLRSKENNEFLLSENKTLNLKYLQHVNSTSNTSHSGISNTSSSSKKRRIGAGVGGHDDHDVSSTMSQVPIKIKTIYKTKLKVINQTTLLQDEKNSFIEYISTFHLSGMEKSSFELLINIKSPIDFQYKDFKIFKNNHMNLKTELMNFLIKFENHNRIDLIIDNFVNILISFVEKLFEIDLQETEKNKNQLKYFLSIPLVLSLINCCLIYRPKAINPALVEKIMQFSTKNLNKFKNIINQDEMNKENKYELINDYSNPLKQQEFNNRSNNKFNKTTNGVLKDEDYYIQNNDSPIKVKILKTFITLYSFDILENITKISINNSSFQSSYYKLYYKDIICNQIISFKTPIYFINNIIEIINNLTEIMIRNMSGEDFSQLMVKLSNLLNVGLLYDFNVFSLNRINNNGSNSMIKLLNLIYYEKKVKNRKNSRELDSTNLLLDDKYLSILIKGNQEILKHNYNKLLVKSKILEYFETFFIFQINSIKHFKVDYLIEITNNFISLLNEQQELIYRQPNEPSELVNLISIRLKIINKSIRLIHHLIISNNMTNTNAGTTTTSTRAMTRNKVNSNSKMSSNSSATSIDLISKLPIDNFRELIISLLRVSFISIKPITEEFIHKLRNNDNYFDFVFNKNQESSNLIKWEIQTKVTNTTSNGTSKKYSIIVSTPNDTTTTNTINKNELINCDLTNANGWEINYDDDIIELSRDILSYCITADEADELYYSMNYIFDQPDLNDLIDMD